MYEGAWTRVKSNVGITYMIPVGVGLHQGSSLSPYLFAMIMDVLAHGIKDLSPWCMLYADDIVLCGTRREVVEKKLEEWRRTMEDRGLKINRKKTVYLRFNVDGNLVGNSDINLQGQNLERVNTFKYIGATLAENGDLDAEMTHRIQSGWQNWTRVSGILCDRRISLRVKGKVYLKTVVRPAMMYGAETWAVKKAQEKKLDVAEMRMLRWMSGVTKLDRIRNERIRGTTKVGEISKKVQESRIVHHYSLMSIAVNSPVIVSVVTLLCRVQAFAEELHEKVRKEHWGYCSEEHLDRENLLRIKYQVRLII